MRRNCKYIYIQEKKRQKDIVGAWNCPVVDTYTVKLETGWVQVYDFGVC